MSAALGESVPGTWHLRQQEPSSWTQGHCLVRQMHTYAVFQFTECVHLGRLKPAPESIQPPSSWKCVRGDGDQVESTYTYAHRDIPADKQPHRLTQLTDTDINTSSLLPLRHTHLTHTSFSQTHTPCRHRHACLPDTYTHLTDTDGDRISAG